MMSDSMKPALLILEPQDKLSFETPVDGSVCKNIVIENPSKNQSVGFKLKTTSPRKFFVRPNIGILGPSEKVKVEIFLQSNVPDAGHKPHKFLIQAALASGDVTNLQEFWKNQKPEDIWDAKLKCEIIPNKPSNEQLRQAGGGPAGSPDAQADGETELDAEEISEPVAKLLKHVSMLEEERLTLKAEIDNLNDQTIMPEPKKRSMEFFKWASCIFTVLVTILAAYYGKYYM